MINTANCHIDNAASKDGYFSSARLCGSLKPCYNVECFVSYGLILINQSIIVRGVYAVSLEWFV